MLVQYILSAAAILMILTITYLNFHSGSIELWCAWISLWSYIYGRQDGMFKWRGN